jgi:glycosyltransferase involved in cell wall biosynthesis
VILYSYYPWDPRPRREAESLARRGMEVDVICLRKDKHVRVHDCINGVNVFQIPLYRRREGKLTYISQYAKFFLAAFTVASFKAVKSRYDLVHVHNMPDFLVFSALMPRLRGARVVLDLHDPMPELFCSIFPGSGSALATWLKRVEKLSIAFADRVLTPNAAFAQLFCSRGCSPQKLDIVMNSPDPLVFKVTQTGPKLKSGSKIQKTIDLTYHGLIVERHGVDLAVCAVNELQNRFPTLHLHIYGETTPTALQIMEMVQRLQLTDRIHFYGAKPQCEIPAAICASDLGIIPNRLNSFTAINLPTRVFEYLSVKRPVIAPRTNGIQDYFKEDELIFFEPGNLPDLTAKIEWALTHPTDVQAILERGFKVYERHRWELEEEKFVRIVGSLVRNGAERQKPA